ncbi:MAG: NAD(P)H-binding protein, partial [Myxococcales bacterium]|nr:NAD(P)H-binding protein [Myxococcales bacterium]
VSLDGKGDWDLERRGAETVAKAAAAAGVSRITLISGASVCEENAWFPMTAAKLAAERAVQASGVPYTILRCTMFMETLRNMVREGKAMLLGDQPQRWHFLAADDFARMVSRAYASPEAANRVLVAFGPEALTLEEALRVYVDRCAPGTPVMKIPFFILGLMSWLPGRAELRRVALPLMKYFAKVPEQGSPVEADRLLGKNEITLERWCAAQLEPPSPTPEEAAPSPP